MLRPHCPFGVISTPGKCVYGRILHRDLPPRCHHCASTWEGRPSHVMTPRSVGGTYHEFAIRPRMAVVETECSSSCGTNMSTGSQAVRSSADIWPKDCAHKTSGDLIFSAKRTRFTLFHACVRSETNALPQGEGTMTYRRNRSEDARLGTQLFVVHGVIPAYGSGRMV